MFIDKIKSIFQKKKEDATLTATIDDIDSDEHTEHEDDSLLDDDVEDIDNRPTLVSRIKNIPLFERFLNKNTSSDKTETEINLSDELANTDDQQYSKKSLFKLSKMKAVIIFAVVFLLLFAEDEVATSVDKVSEVAKEKISDLNKKNKIEKDSENKDVNPVLEKNIENLNSDSKNVDELDDIKTEVVERDDKEKNDPKPSDIETISTTNETVSEIKKEKKEVVPELDLSEIRSDKTIDVVAHETAESEKNVDSISDDIFGSDDQTDFDVNEVAAQPSFEVSEDIVGDESGFSEEEQTGEITSDILKSIEQKITNEKEKLVLEKSASESFTLDYNESGRGLVFNCIDGHWACVSGHVYNNCHQLNQIERANMKGISCYADSIFETDRFCAKAQLEKITKMVVKDFCKK